MFWKKDSQMKSFVLMYTRLHLLRGTRSPIKSYIVGGCQTFISMKNVGLGSETTRRHGSNLPKKNYSKRSFQNPSLNIAEDTDWGSNLAETKLFRRCGWNSMLLTIIFESMVSPVQYTRAVPKTAWLKSCLFPKNASEGLAAEVAAIGTMAGNSIGSSNLCNQYLQRHLQGEIWSIEFWGVVRLTHFTMAHSSEPYIRRDTPALMATRVTDFDCNGPGEAMRAFSKQRLDEACEDEAREDGACEVVTR
ncbi:uncharacterized protein BDR25DRAFT_354509 [Lindgomyces ingoldianus]|uniref:Uncharacterized protein n=1 Tax=Lindgomyces ingoldianus TaxID=673940 RepID=A0ACB6QW62_9PLEO|nr:uncharacterized protein BDR25DRAFT_354509 [Lindgomyces ingoldianus]KAF2471258.1 hypothetical protein BDR25DRAFT_354509 [Lindgomyces ingoldianus]